jgi:tetratricopeptide (TPR) repeat protein
MPDPIALTLGVWALGSAVGGAIGNLTDRNFCLLQKRLAERALPRNHDLALAVRRAQLLALRITLEGYGRLETPSWRSSPGYSVDDIVAPISDYIGTALRKPDVAALDSRQQATILREIETVFIDPEPTDEPAARRIATFRRLVEDLTLAEAKTRALSMVDWDRFEQLFREGHSRDSQDSTPPWWSAFRGFLGDTIKNDPRVASILSQQTLSEVLGRQIDMAEVFVDLQRGQENLLAQLGPTLAEFRRGVDRFDGAIESFDVVLRTLSVAQRRSAMVAGLTLDKIEQVAAQAVSIETGVSAARVALEEQNKKLDAAATEQATISGKIDELLRAVQPHGLSRDRVIELANSVNSDISNFDDAVRELEYLIEVARHHLFSGARGNNLDGFASGVLAKARQLRFQDGADAIDSALLHLERDNVDAANWLARVEQSRVSLLEAGILQDKLAMRVTAAAKKEIALIRMSYAPDKVFAAIMSAQDAYFERGQMGKIRMELEIATAMCREAARGAKSTRERAAAHVSLGDALCTLGTLESSPTRLEEAVLVYRTALNFFDRKRHAKIFARIQTNLGVALCTLGEREIGTKRLEEAVTAQRIALKAWAQEADRKSWAKMKNHLGSALALLGAREPSIERLKEAITAYREVLAEIKPEADRSTWASVQSNLGNSLSSLAAQKFSIASREEAKMPAIPDELPTSPATKTLSVQRLAEAVSAHREAVSAHREALMAFVEDGNSHGCASARMNLGSVLSDLGECHFGLDECEAGTACFEEATALFREALGEFDPNRDSLGWAKAQANLGATLFRLGWSAGRMSQFEEAAAAYREALKQFTQNGSPVQWAKTKLRLGQALFEIGKREGGTARLQEAVAVYREALMEYSQENGAYSWALAQDGLDAALMLIDQRTGP